MAEGFLQRFPDLSVLVNSASSLEGPLNGLWAAVSSLDPQSIESPLTSLNQQLADLDSKVNVDIVGISENLPDTIRFIQELLPPGALEYIEAIEEAYRHAGNFLSTTAVASAIQEGHTLTETVLALIEDTLNALYAHTDDLMGNIVDPEVLEQLRLLLATIDAYQTGPPPSADEVLPFLADTMLGVSPDILTEPLAHVQDVYIIIENLQPDTLPEGFDTAKQDLSAAYAQVVQAMDTLNPATASDYLDIQQRLSELDTLLDVLLTTLENFYSQFNTVIDTYPWDAIFSNLAALIEPIRFDDLLTIDDVINTMTGVLEDLLAPLNQITDGTQLAAQLAQQNQLLRDTVAASPLGHVQQTLSGFLEQIRQAIEAVPIEEVRATVESILSQVASRLSNLGVDQLVASLEAAFTEIDEFITGEINEQFLDSLMGQVQGMIGGSVESINASISTFVAQLTSALSQLQTLFSEIDSTLQNHSDGVRELLSSLEKLSFEPISETVIAEIDEIKNRLQSMNPNSLSDVEKTAIKLALAALEALDLETQVIQGIKSGYGEAQDQISALLTELEAVLQRLHDNVSSFNAHELLEPFSNRLDELSAHIGTLNGKLLLKPVTALVDQFEAQLTAISPGVLLDPLQAPYETLLVAINRLDPLSWTAPLQSIYEQIQDGLAAIDFMPVFNRLDELQKEIHNTITTTILNTLDNINLPAPLDAFFAGLRPIFDRITDAIFNQTETELKNINDYIQANIDPMMVLAPLDAAFDKLSSVIDSIPEQQLTIAMNAIRESIGVGVYRLDPQQIHDRFRQGQRQLNMLAPINMLEEALQIESLGQIFDEKTAAASDEYKEVIQSIRAQFDALSATLDPTAPDSPYQRLTHRHVELVNLFFQKIDALNPDDVLILYVRLREKIEHLLPDFLRSTTSLTYDDIKAGIDAMRPSSKAVKLSQIFDDFFSKMQEFESQMTPVLDDLFLAIKEILTPVNPLFIKQGIEDIYSTIDEKLSLLEPNAIATALREAVFEPLAELLEAISPNRIKLRINQSYERAVQAITTALRQFIADLADAIDALFRVMRESVNAIVGQVGDIIDTGAQTVDVILKDLEQLIFVDFIASITQSVENLGFSFDKEINRVRNAFDEMLNAIPV